MEIEYKKFELLSPNEKLDFILKNLNHEDLSESIHDIEKKLKWDINQKIDKAVNQIIVKLYMDGYIIVLKQNDESFDLTFYILFEGIVFIENGGYKKQAERNTQKLLTQKIINYSLIFGGVAGGCYYMGLILYWIWNHLQFLCLCFQK